MNIITLLRQLLCKENIEDINTYKQRIKAYTEEINALNKEKQLLNLKLNKYISKEKEDKEAEYWNNKWTKADITYKCRYLPNKKNILFEIDVKDFITTNSSILKNIVSNFNLRGDTYDKTAYNCLNWVIRWLRYTSDKSSEGYSEFWQFPFESVKLKTGDCEDGAILLVSLMGAAGIPANRRKVCAGWVKTKTGKGGHAYAIYRRESDEEWIPLDWCYWAKPNKPIEQFTIHKEDKNYEDIWFTFNEEYSWRQTNFVIKGGKLK